LTELLCLSRFSCSVYPAWTNEWWVGRIAPGLGHFDKTAFTPIEGAHGVLDYGGVYAAKTGADSVVDQRLSTRRVMFSSTGWQRKGVPGCEPQQTMPRELSLSNASEAALFGVGGAPFLWIEPAAEIMGVRTTTTPKFHATAVPPPGLGGAVAAAAIPATGAQIEVLVSCSGMQQQHDDHSQEQPSKAAVAAAPAAVELTVLQSTDGKEGVVGAEAPAFLECFLYLS
jgi:hypothetical protein